ncbi:MAG TPA: hypothetical protein DEP66_03815, partial [Acidimicrobiaceae bacterium]|nr:hypothetical protein [Acidimicrobiaceae bacterium]HCB37335.1 hypothetical protein [Acidimicrobiaceae bacterium]
MSRSAAARGVASPVRLIAPAKLTLSLRVAGVRADGYHLIDAVMTTLDLCDELTLAPGTGLEAVPDGAAAPAGPDNLVTAALALAG